MAFVVPPGGPAGFRQMTPASRRALFPGTRSSSSRKRRSKKTAKRTKGRKRSGKRGKLPKFGSPAWRKKFKLGKK